MSDPTIAASPIAALTAKLAEVRRRGLTCFGSKTHQFRWNPPLAEEEVRAFEERHGITLPGDYRRFLLEAGNGGAGPFYGILPLERYNDTVAEEEFADYLAEPSPLRPDLPRNATDDEWERLLGRSCETMFYQGSIAIAHQGCSYYSNLIVSGPFRGRVVYLSTDSLNGCYFVRHHDFLLWYERWLDELLAGWDLGWYGFGMPGSEVDLASVLMDPATTSDDRSEALQSLCKIPQPEQTTFEVVRAQLGNGGSEVRRRAINILAERNHPKVDEDLTRMASDPDGEVRAASLSALAKRPAPPWDLIRHGLDDSNPDVVRRTIYAIKDGQVLTGDEVRRFLSSSDPDRQSLALWAGGSLPPDPATAALVVALLTSPEMRVRQAAIFELGRQTGPSQIPVLLDHWRRETNLESTDALIRVLGESGSRDAVPALINAIGSPDAFTRYHAADALGKVGDPDAIPALKLLLDDPVKPERRSGDGRLISAAGLTVGDKAREALRALGEEA